MGEHTKTLERSNLLQDVKDGEAAEAERRAKEAELENNPMLENDNNEQEAAKEKEQIKQMEEEVILLEAESNARIAAEAEAWRQLEEEAKKKAKGVKVVAKLQDDASRFQARPSGNGEKV